MDVSWIYTSLPGSNTEKTVGGGSESVPGEGGQLKTRATCVLQEKRLLFRGFSSFMSLNMDHVHMRRGRTAPKLPCPAQQ